MRLVGGFAVDEILALPLHAVHAALNIVDFLRPEQEAPVAQTQTADAPELAMLRAANTDLSCQVAALADALRQVAAVSDEAETVRHAVTVLLATDARVLRPPALARVPAGRRGPVRRSG
jgi:hypothetical protein